MPKIYNTNGPVKMTKKKLKKDPQIVKFKLTNSTKKGKPMQHIKLVGIDKRNKEYYIKFVSRNFAEELLFHSHPGEVVNNITENRSKANEDGSKNTQI